MEEDNSLIEWKQDKNDKSQPATMREIFNMNCHIQEYVHQAHKESVKRMLIHRKGDVNRVNAVSELLKAVIKKQCAFEKLVKSFKECDLNEVMYI